MGKIVVSEFVSLDGVMEDPGGAEGFKHGGWTFASNTAAGRSSSAVPNRSSGKLRNSSTPMPCCWAAGPIKGLPPHGRRCLEQGPMGSG